MEIREARPADYEAIGDLTVAAYVAVNPHAMRGDYDRELRDVASRVTDCVVLVAVDGDGVLGSVTYVPGPGTALSEFGDDDAAGMRMLAVDPSRQRSGAGRALTEACIELARNAGRRILVLHTTAPMVVAQAMYERRGFVRAPGRDMWFAEEPFSTAEPLHLIAYELRL
jgi:ribosomal protein S18 acetylase RimI-like enzyme